MLLWINHRRELFRISFAAFPHKAKVIAIHEKGRCQCNLELDTSFYSIYTISLNFNYRNKSLLLKGLKGHQIESGEQRGPLLFHFLKKSKLKQRLI